MGCRLRLWEPHIVYSATIRTNDRQFLLKPNHDPKHLLLAAGCPPQALDEHRWSARVRTTPCDILNQNFTVS